MAYQYSFSRDADPPGPLTNEHRMSRRAILQKLVGLTLAGGSITSIITSCSSPTSLSPQPQNPIGSPTSLFPQSPASIYPSLKTALYIYRGHSASVVTVVWSPDGKRIASGSNDGTAQVWDAANGGHVLIYREHTDSVWSVAWSPDGKRIVSGSGNIDNGRGDTTAQVWNATNGELILIYRGHSEPVRSVAWSPDNTRIASGSADMTVQVWRT